MLNRWYIHNDYIHLVSSDAEALRLDDVGERSTRILRVSLECDWKWDEKKRGPHVL